MASTLIFSLHKTVMVVSFLFALSDESINLNLWFQKRFHPAKKACKKGKNKYFDFSPLIGA